MKKRKKTVKAEKLSWQRRLNFFFERHPKFRLALFWFESLFVRFCFIYVGILVLFLLFRFFFLSKEIQTTIMTIVTGVVTILLVPIFQYYKKRDDDRLKVHAEINKGAYEALVSILLPMFYAPSKMTNHHTELSNFIAKNQVQINMHYAEKLIFLISMILLESGESGDYGLCEKYIEKAIAHIRKQLGLNDKYFLTGRVLNQSKFRSTPPKKSKQQE